MTVVGLVGCAAGKLRRPAAARDLYTSALFRKSAAYVQAHADCWFVLSAEHGLVHPDTVLAPYDTRLGSKSGPPVWAWAQRVVDQLTAATADLDDVELLVLAGEQYRTVLHLVDIPAQVPLSGLGIGDQLGALTAALTAGRRLPGHRDQVRATTG